MFQLHQASLSQLMHFEQLMQLSIYCQQKHSQEKLRVVAQGNAFCATRLMAPLAPSWGLCDPTG